MVLRVNSIPDQQSLYPNGQHTLAFYTKHCCGTPWGFSRTSLNIDLWGVTNSSSVIVHLWALVHPSFRGSIWGAGGY